MKLYLISTFNDIYYSEWRGSYVYQNESINLNDQTVIKQIKYTSMVNVFTEFETAQKYAQVNTQIFHGKWTPTSFQNKKSWTSFSFVIEVNLAEIELSENVLSKEFSSYKIAREELDLTDAKVTNNKFNEKQNYCLVM
jgi:hypothetical protein